MTKEQRKEIFNGGYRAWLHVGNIDAGMQNAANSIGIEVSEQELNDISIELAMHIQTLKD